MRIFGNFSYSLKAVRRLHTDIIDRFPPCINGKNCMFIIVCAFSILVICTALPNQTTNTASKAAINDVIAEHGIPSF